MSYLHELQTLFENCILFFYGSEENVIAGLWKPTSTSTKAMSLKIAYSTSPVLSDSGDDGGDHVILNKESILNEIAHLGGGLVHDLEIK